MRSLRRGVELRKIAISGLVALAAVLGGVAVPATAMAQPTAAVAPGITARPGEMADAVPTGEPQISCLTPGKLRRPRRNQQLNREPGHPHDRSVERQGMEARPRLLAGLTGEERQIADGAMAR
jgi:hypothetical protein